jgi:hypothetical protein
MVTRERAPTGSPIGASRFHRRWNAWFKHCLERQLSHPGRPVLGLVGQALIIVGVALALPSTEYGFLVSVGGLTRILAATTLAGAIGALLGAGLGAVIRNLGGAVTAVVLALFMT